MRGSARLTHKTHRLMKVAGQLTGKTSGYVSHLCEEILANEHFGEDPLQGASCLNNDGSPLQLCISCHQDSPHLRLIGDPGSHLANPVARLKSSRQALTRCLSLSGSEDLLPAAEKTLSHVIPTDPEALARYQKGFLWLGLSPDHDGLAFYLETAPMARKQGWDTTEAWLSDLLPTCESAIPILSKLREHATVASMGIEGSSSKNARAKIYFRLAHTVSLDQLGLELLASPEMAAFLHLAMADFGLDRNGLVISIGFHLKDGKLADLKVDLCGHCLRYDQNGWVQLIETLCEKYQLANPNLAQYLTEERCTVAFIGLGLTSDYQPRLNVYLSGLAASHSSGRIKATAHDAARFLLKCQEANHSWIDYHLPVGQSDQWITSYIGLALAEYGNTAGCSSSLKAANQAASWLQKNRSYEAGWGYHSFTGPDADSTALAISFLTELSKEIRAEDRSFLRALWREGQGIATYDEPSAWGSAHWDVTPYGFLALDRATQKELLPEFSRALISNQIAGGLWRSYWWKTPLYSTYTTLDVLEKLAYSEPEPLPASSPPQTPDNAFDLACQIGIHLHRDSSFQPKRLAPLLHIQKRDGSWPGHANLRVTENTCYEPWYLPKGQYYCDEKSLMTTATALRVLTKALKKGAPQQSSPSTQSNLISTCS